MFRIPKDTQKNSEKFFKSFEKAIWQNVYKMKGERKFRRRKIQFLFDPAYKTEKILGGEKYIFSYYHKRKIVGGDNTYGCTKIATEKHRCRQRCQDAVLVD